MSQTLSHNLSWNLQRQNTRLDINSQRREQENRFFTIDPISKRKTGNRNWNNTIDIRHEIVPSLSAHFNIRQTSSESIATIDEKYHPSGSIDNRYDLQVDLTQTLGWGVAKLELKRYLFDLSNNPTEYGLPTDPEEGALEGEKKKLLKKQPLQEYLPEFTLTSLLWPKVQPIDLKVGGAFIKEFNTQFQTTRQEFEMGLRNKEHLIGLGTRLDLGGTR